MSPEWIKRILQIISIIVGLWTGGATAINVADTVEKNREAGQGAVMGEATPANAPVILGNATLTGLMGLLFANSKRIAEFVTKTTGSNVAGGAVYAIGISIQKQQWEATKSPKARNDIRKAAVSIVENEIFPLMPEDSVPVTSNGPSAPLRPGDAGYRANMMGNTP